MLPTGIFTLNSIFSNIRLILDYSSVTLLPDWRILPESSESSESVSLLFPEGSPPPESPQSLVPNILSD